MVRVAPVTHHGGVRPRPSPPRLEHGSTTFVGTGRPRLSWTVDHAPPGWRQLGYEVEVRGAGGDRTASVHSADSVLVPWPFAELRSRGLADVRVRVIDGDGPGEWSEWATAEATLLDPADWVAVPVCPARDPAAETTFRTRSSFQVGGRVVRARLYATAYGVYTVQINGADVGSEVLAPGWTSYEYRLRFQTFDVTELIRTGANAIGITVAEGWYAGKVGFAGGVRAFYGPRCAAFAQLEVTVADGSVHVVATDATWATGPSPYVSASLYDGEHYDARLDDPGWSSGGYDASAWPAADTLDSPTAMLVAPSGPPVTRHEEFAPIKIWTSPAGATLVDFGQNISGRIRLHGTAPAGHAVVVRHAEVLEDDELGTRPLRQAAATDTYVFAGGGIESHEPAFTIHGFRYAQVDGWPDDLRPENVTAVACYSAVGEIGEFGTSNADLNRLHHNVHWSMKGNFVDIPTDCPQRDERLGWTGDIQVFAPTAAFLGNCAGFLESWLADLAVEQIEYGTVPVYVPWVPLLFPPAPGAAWGDAAVIVPWVLYERYGDAGILARQYPSMRAWVDQIASIAGGSHLWDTGFQFGDWLDPAAPPDQPAAARTDAHLVATAYHAHTARLLATTAAVLGKDEDATRYTTLADEVARAFAAEYVTPSGRLASDAQTAYALALRFDLLPTSAQRARAGQRLAQLVRAEDFHIGTGFVGTPMVCDALADTGHVDDAYHLLLQTSCPSWLYPVSMGATTIWERWDSMLPDGRINPGEMTSFNHYALGAVADFMHRRIAGLAPGAAGYRRMLVSPLPGGGLTSARAAHRTPYGQASVSWERVGDRFALAVTVPPSATAELRLPDGSTPFDVGSGTHQFACTWRAPADDPPRPKRRHPFDLDQ